MKKHQGKDRDASKAGRQAPAAGSPAPKRGRRTPDDVAEDPALVRTLICIACGAEQYFEDETEVPSSLKCEKCDGSVFREFDTSTRPDEVQLEQLEETRRSAAWGDASPQTSRDDLRDLDIR